MNDSISPFALHAVADRVGLATSVRTERGDQWDSLLITPSDLHANEGFAVQLRFGWRSVEAVVIPGLFSGQLIARMGSCHHEAQHIFASIAEGLISKKVKVLMRVNDVEINAIEPQTWPSAWTKFGLSLKLTPIVIDLGDTSQQERMVLDVAIPILNMMVALVGAEETQLLTNGEDEGRPSEILSKRYERKRINREACIQLKGYRCLACGFDFAEAYGPLGVGYIEVHHLKPLSTVGADYQIDVATELAPLCANCHRMAHREEPPVPVERLRQIAEDHRRAASI